MRNACVLAAALVPVLAMSPAFAQEAQEQEVVIADLVYEEAIILVRGRQELRFSAPVSSARIAGNEADGLLTLDQVATAVPGLWMINDQDPGTNIVSMRGVTTDRLQQAAIVYVLDGVPLADTEFFTGPLFDLHAITVLRGPQGALFGKGAAGGVIAIDTSGTDQPGYGLLGAGTGAFRIAEGAIAGEIADGWSARLSGQWRAADGWITNQTLGRVVDAEESRSVRLRMINNGLGPADVDLGLFVMQDDGGAAWASSGDVTGDFGGELDGAALTDPIGDFEGRASRQWVQARARVNFDTPVGALSLLAAQDAYQKRWVEELDYRPGPLTFFGAPLFPNGLQPIAQPTDIDATTLEARLTGEWGTTDYVVGVFAQDVDRLRTDDFGPLLFGGPAATYDTESQQTAIFAGVFHNTGAWRWEAQARFDRDDRTQSITAAGTLVERREATFERFQPRVALSYAFAQSGMIYASYGEGFRSGGFNPQPGPASAWRAQFEPEVTRSLEVGARARGGAGDIEWRLEAAGFASAIDQYQNYTFLDGQSVTLNVDEVSVRGGEVSGEVESTFHAAWSTSLAGGFALAETNIERYVAPDPLIPGATRNYAGRRVPNAPVWTGSVSAGVNWQGGNERHADGSLTLNGAGETFYEIDNALRSPPRAWLDAQASYTAHGWRATLWGRNITDERWAISAFGQGMLPLLQGLGPGGPFDTFTINRGRQWGFSLRRDF
jgi:iron complex outermembrane recepter protein